MAVEDLNHVNINAPLALLAEIRDFYVNIIGLHEGWRPDVPVAGYWLYAADKPVLHLMDTGIDADGVSAGPLRTGVTGHVDHIAFTCTDVDAMEQHLQQQGTDYVRRDFPTFSTVQLVVKDPAGMAVELNFTQ